MDWFIGWLMWVCMIIFIHMITGGPVENSPGESEGGLQPPRIRAVVLQEAQVHGRARRVQRWGKTGRRLFFFLLRFVLFLGLWMMVVMASAVAVVGRCGSGSGGGVCCGRDISRVLWKDGGLVVWNVVRFTGWETCCWGKPFSIFSLFIRELSLRLDNISGERIVIPVVLWTKKREWTLSNTASACAFPPCLTPAVWIVAVIQWLWLDGATLPYSTPLLIFSLDENHLADV